MDNIKPDDFEIKYAGAKKLDKLSLNDRIWKEFSLHEFFTPVQSKGDIKTNEIIAGDIPLISAVKGSNGVGAFIAFGDGKAELFKKGCLTADMFGHVFYQPKEFYSVSHGRVNILIPLVNFNIYQSLFIAKVLEHQFNIRNSYSRMLTKTMLEKCKVSLPIVNEEDRTPDWKFMENYIKSLSFSQNID